MVHQLIATRAFLQLLTGLAVGAIGGLLLIDLLLGDQDVFHADPVVLVGAFAALIMVVCAAACLSPTLKGLKIQPVEALKEH